MNTRLLVSLYINQTRNCQSHYEVLNLVKIIRRIFSDTYIPLKDAMPVYFAQKCLHHTSNQ